jgi:hypothetical protein
MPTDGGVQGDALQVTGAVPVAPVDKLQSQIATGEVNADAYAGFATEEKVGEDSLAALSSLAAEMIAAEKALAAANAAVIVAKNNLADVQEKRLPDMMEKHGLTRFDFTDQTTKIKRTIELISKWAVSMPPKQGKTADPQWSTKHEAIYDWLVKIGKGGIIKKDFTVPLGLVSDDDTNKLVAEWKAAHPDLEVKVDKYVESATLTSVISKMKDDGEEVNTFVQVKPRREAKIKGGK